MNMKLFPREALFLSVLLLVNQLSAVFGQSRIKKRVITVWWGIINNPEPCRTGGEEFCTFDDTDIGSILFDAEEYSIVYGGAGITDENGQISLVTSIYKTQCNLDGIGDLDARERFLNFPPLLDPITSLRKSVGYCPKDEDIPIEVHPIIRDMGPPSDDLDELRDQMTNYYSSVCSEEFGDNACVDVGTAAWIVEEDGVQQKPLVNVQKFSPGCAGEGTCTLLEESLQLGKTPSVAKLITTGDALQLQVNVKVPSIPRKFYYGSDDFDV